MKRWEMLAIAAAVAGCTSGCIGLEAGSAQLVSSDGFIDEGDVTNLPPGDMTGTALSGFYRIERFAILDQACARGSTAGVSGFGDPGVDGFVFEHIDGQASLLTWLGTPIPDPVFAGGIDADGDFGLGASADLRSESGAIVGEVLYRIDGEIVGELMRSTWKKRVRYPLSGDEIDCEEVAEIDARFEAGGEGDACTLDADCPSFAPNCVADSCYDGTVGDPCDDPSDCAVGTNCDGTPLVCR